MKAQFFLVLSHSFNKRIGRRSGSVDVRVKSTQVASLQVMFLAQSFTNDCDLRRSYADGVS